MPGHTRLRFPTLGKTAVWPYVALSTDVEFVTSQYCWRSKIKSGLRQCTLYRNATSLHHYDLKLDYPSKKPPGRGGFLTMA